jgi:uncharacterized protein YodC (DUF2158 family)
MIICRWCDGACYQKNRPHERELFRCGICERIVAKVSNRSDWK